VQELQQREEAVGQRARQHEVAHHAPAEHRQRIEPFGHRRHRVLRQPVPRQHVAVDRRHVDQRDGHQPTHPAERAEAAIAIEGEVPREVQQHDDDHRRRRVAVQAARDAAGPPLRMRQALHRCVSSGQSGLVERVHVQAADEHDAEHQAGDLAEVIQRVQRFARHAVERGFDAQERRADEGVYR